MRLLKSIFFLLLLLPSVESFATHNRSGEITYEYLGAGQYKVRITTYTNYNGPSVNADRCDQTLYIRDFSGAYLDSVLCLRTNGTSICTSNPLAKEGVILDPGTNNFKKNVYEGVITLNSGANYILYMFDPNRNGGIVNIPGDSSQQPFALTDTLKTFNIPGLTVNSTPTLLNPPIDEACVGKLFIHNPNAYDVNGDSLSYDLSTIFGAFAMPIPGYIVPTPSSGGAISGISINHITGDFIWNTPSIQGEFNFGILITEWRKTADGEYIRIGSVLRDLQINVRSCANNPPVIDDIPDACIVAGTNYIQTITASDPDNNTIDLVASGGPFNLNPPAIFNYTPGSGNVTGSMTWTPACNAVRNQPYLITVKATDQPLGNDPALTHYESFLIRVVAPPPQNFTVTPVGTNMVLNWSAPAICSQTTGNIIVSYLIYRKNACANYTPSPCETGVPASLGYTQIGSVNAIGVTNPNFTFTDNNGGLGLSQGVDYSYIVVAYFADGSNSLASAVVCVKLVRSVPLLTNVSVDTTDLNVGELFIRWTKPVVKTGSNDGLDTIVNTGPYEYRLYQSIGQSSAPINQVYSVTHTYFSEFNSLTDSTYTNTSLNTEANAYNYRVDFYCNGILKGTSQPASSVRLTATGLARRVQLNWTYQTSWNNDTTFIYRQNALGGYDLIGNTITQTYTDTGLVNGINYCYKVLTSGKYSDPSILNPLLNWSQKDCAVPQDTEAPCQPTITATGDCNTQITQVTWVNGAQLCSEDIIYYNLYYTPFLDSSFVKIDSFPKNIQSFTTDYAFSIAGCYAVTAVDSFGNESSIVDKMCVDNCPEYELPNIITINGDSINDFFIPIRNRFVKDIDLKIYNRWGTLMFETTDPAIGWDGKNVQSKQACVSGTYYYICDVHIIRYTGIETIKLKGFLQIIKN